MSEKCSAGYRQGAVRIILACPRCCKREDGLDSYIEAFHVEGLEHDLGRVFPIFRRVERRLCLRDSESAERHRTEFFMFWFYQAEIMLFWLASKMLKNAALPKPFHMIPIFNLLKTSGQLGITQVLFPSSQLPGHAVWGN
jgi:hypothetical protein